MLEPRSFGRVRFIPGGKDARWPFSNTLVVDDQARVVIDPGAGRERLQAEIARGVDLLINTHTHGDHVRGNGDFARAARWVPVPEAHHFGDFAAWGRSLGIEAVFGADENARFVHACETGEMTMRNPVRVHPKAVQVMARKPDHTYADGHEWSFGDTQVRAVHVPGHTGGLMALHFVNEGAVFVTDFDLTPFGPWYGQPESDPNDFEASAAKLRRLDAEWYITSHEFGYLQRRDFVAELDRFMAVIPAREERIRKLLHLSESEIYRAGAVYFKHLVDRDPWIVLMGTLMVRKHLHRLGADDKIEGPYHIAQT
jgi:glyoxylase-like metal-dependent hydrolase (beta-lactamase superfamily II)